MKQIVLAALVWGGLVGARPQDRGLEKKKDWLTTFTSARYEVRSNCTREQAKKLADHMDLVFETYVKLFALRQVPSKRAVLVLFRDEKEYLANPEAPKNSGAYYDPNIKFLVGYYDDRRMFNVFAHEGMHQFTDIALKGFERSPPWFTEGMAECIGNSVVDKGRLFMCAKNGVIAQDNLPVIQEMIQKKTHVPLKSLVRMSQAEWDRTPGMYPEAWSFCYFLLAYPKYEDTRSQIPNGKYWTVLSNYLRLLSQPNTTADEAFRASFQVNGKPLDLDQLEAEWSKWVLDMRNAGDRGREELPVGLSKERVTGPKGEAGPGVVLLYPAKSKGADAEPDRSNAPYPLLLFASDEEAGAFKLCDWLSRGLAAHGFLAAVVETGGAAPAEASARLVAARDWVARRNAAPDWKLKGMVDAAKVVAVGHAGGGHAALLAAADAAKFAGALAFAPSGIDKVPERLKVPTLLMFGEDELERGAKLYAQLKKPRYLFALAGLDRSFMPSEKAGTAYQISISWLCYKFSLKDDWKTYVVGDEAKKDKEKGVFKDWRFDE